MGYDRNAKLAARDHFREARKLAFVNEVLSALSGEPNDLLSFQEVQQRLGVQSCGLGRLEAIPLDKIVGSEGRYHDFDREFLPLHSGTVERWERLDVAYELMENVPPIDVYKVGDVYFVRDGNHRVSVAKRRGASYIDANIIDCPSRVVLGTGVSVPLLLVEEEHLQFLRRTRLDEILGTDVRLTASGAYDALERHLQGHRYFMGAERGAEVPFDEAAQSWYDNVYLPTVNAIRGAGVLRRFPKRTEGDLYIWVLEHHYYLRQKYGDSVSLQEAAASFAGKYGVKPHQRLYRWGAQRVASFVGSILAMVRR